MSVIPRTVHSVVGKLVKIAEKTPNLRTVAKIEFSMCPWQENSNSTKQMWTTVSGEEIRDSNRKCNITTAMKHDNTEPFVRVEFNDGEKLLLKGANLMLLEMMYHFNAFCHHKEEAAQGMPQKLF